MRRSCTLLFLLFYGNLFAQITTLPTNYSLAPYSGPWTEREAAHLLRRCLFGPTYNQIQTAVTDGMNTTVTNLFTMNPVGMPLTYHTDEAISTLGTPWNISVYPATNKDETNNARIRSLAGWMIENLLEDTTSIQQKMVLFWHNFFSVTESSDARAHLDYFLTIYGATLTDVKKLVQEMTINPNMLDFLNGNTNTGTNPNENYAREFLELFTVGKSDQIAPGDYTTYTEQDVTAGAKIFSGYETAGFRSTTITSPYATFNPAKHDATAKTLSHHFNSSTIAPAGALEYEAYIDTVFNSPQFGDFLCEEIYRFFVASQIDSTVHDSIISGMKTTLINNSFDILPVMQQLLTSQHFYDFALRGSLMKSPAEYIFSMYNATSSVVDFDFDSDRQIWLRIYYRLRDEGMDLLNPPSVAGYPAYYQEPGFGKQWVSAVFYQTRTAFINTYVLGNGFTANGNKFQINALKFLDNLSNPTNAVDVVNDMCLIFAAKDVDPIDKLAIKNVLTDGLPDFEWTNESTDYYANPGNSTYSDPVAARIRATLAAVFKLYIFQTF